MARLARDAVLELEARRKLYDLVVSSPGLHFRELLRRTGMAYGTLQYHLEFLGRHGLVSEEKGAEYSRFFSASFKSIREREVISLLRQDSVRRILLHLLEGKASRNRDVADATGLSPSTVSWHLSRLIMAGAVAQKESDGETSYFISEPEVVTRLLVTYKSSFLDMIVDRFVEVWERENLGGAAPSKAEP